MVPLSQNWHNILNNYETNKNLNMQCLENLYSSHKISSPILNPCNCKFICECEQNYANRKTKNSSNKNTTETDLSLNSINQSFSFFFLIKKKLTIKIVKKQILIKKKLKKKILKKLNK